MPERRPSTKPAEELAEAARFIRQRGWNVGPGGSYSVLLARKPVRLCITSGGEAGGEFDDTNFLEIDDDAEILHGFGRPADETLLHLAIYRHKPRARCILFSRTVAGMVLSDRYFTEGAISIRGYEVLRGLPGIHSYEDEVVVPLIENSADPNALAHVFENILIEQKGIPAVMVRRNGLYTWGETVGETLQALEILEFLFKVIERSR